MKEYKFYKYLKKDDKIKIYMEEISKYFDINFNIIINNIDFNKDKNITLNITEEIEKTRSIEIEKKLLNNIKHLNDVEIINFQIILTFNTSKIELC